MKYIKQGKKKFLSFFAVLAVAVLSFSGCEIVVTDAENQTSYSQNASSDLQSSTSDTQTDHSDSYIDQNGVVDWELLPEYAGEPYIVVNDNVPTFDETQMNQKAIEYYGALDAYGRCTAAYANVCVELMPTEDRGSISQIKPTGWQKAEYDFVDGKYLYNRCHLIGFQLTGENANAQNLITGTRYLNVEGMLPFENMVADYVKETENHVLYRVTPVFHGKELVARGVQMEAFSVEDEGDGVCFNVYCYNNQPGVVIDYATGESKAAEQTGEQQDFILNTNNRKFHLPTCTSVSSMSPANKQEYHGSRELLIEQGYEPCGRCKP